MSVRKDRPVLLVFFFAFLALVALLAARFAASQSAAPLKAAPLAASLSGGRQSEIGAARPAAVQVRADWQQVSGDTPAYRGIEYGWVDQDRELFLTRYHLLNPNLLRVQISQEAFEPENDNADPHSSAIDFNRVLSLDMQQGKTITFRDMFTTLAQEFPEMNFQMNMWLAARWNASDPDGYLGLGGKFPPLNYAEHGEFVRELARWLVDTCGITPDRLSFSFINEPNLKSFFTGSQADLVRMAQETRAALDQVSPQIAMLGVDEVHGLEWTDQFYPQRPAGCCASWTFHAYEKGTDSLWAALQERIDRLSPYGPVVVTEFADTMNGSPDAAMDFSTPQAALGFAQVLGPLWSSGIQGVVHFRLADSYLTTENLSGWAGHGLFADWRGTKSGGQPYAVYPAFWVFSRLFNEFGDGQVISTTAPSNLSVMAVRQPCTPVPRLALWLTNAGDTAVRAEIHISNFPTRAASVETLDNLAGGGPLNTQAAAGASLAFQVELPAHSSYTIRVLAEEDAPVTVAPVATSTKPIPTETEPVPTATKTGQERQVYLPMLCH